MRAGPSAITLLVGLLAAAGVAAAGPGAPAHHPHPAGAVPAQSPEAFERALAADPRDEARRLAPLAASLMDPDPAVREPAGEFLAACSRARGLRLSRRGGPWGDDDLHSLVSLLLVEPDRFLADDAFRARVTELLPRSLAPETAPALTAQVLFNLYVEVGGFSFADSEAIEVAWGAVPRSSAPRQVRIEPGKLRFPDELSDPITASIFSFPSNYFDAESARRLLAALRRIAPERTLVALTDVPMTWSLAAAARSLGVTLVETYGRPYSPWPRDPFSAAIRPDGGLALVERPYRQKDREEDFYMARELIQALPPALDRKWGEPVWGEAPIPFHNGHVLMAGGAAWVSLHSLERQILGILGLERVPVETFSTAAGIDRYVAAAHQAMRRMEELYAKPVHLVHPLPESGPTAERSALMRRIGGGAGFDLDSIVTFLPGEGDRLHALVADPAAGRRLLAGLDGDEWQTLSRVYGLTPAGDALTARLLAYQETPRTAALQGFLDLVAEHLTATGMRVLRLPLVLVPVALLPDSGELAFQDFVLGWNNVVVEIRGGRAHAEGFASLLPSGDRIAVATFARAGTDLDLLPPLVASVTHNGGYRCASNQVRAPGPTAPSPGAEPGPR